MFKALNKRVLCFTANRSLVGILITIGDVTVSMLYCKLPKVESLKQITTATATRFNEQNNDCARAL